MDKTRNKIFVGCLALLLVMVVGYALFSQNLTISGTAKAEGDFSVVSECTPGVHDNLKDLEFEFDENGYYDDSCTVNGNVINLQAGVKWPGAQRVFTIKVTNTGSIDAIASFGDYTGEFCADQNDNDKYDSDECLVDKDGVTLGQYVFNSAIESTPIAIKSKDGQAVDFYSMSEEEQSKFLTEDEKFILKPGYSAYYYASIGLNDNVDKTKFMMQLKWSTTLTFTQPKA